MFLPNDKTLNSIFFFKIRVILVDLLCVIAAEFGQLWAWFPGDMVVVTPIYLECILISVHIETGSIRSLRTGK